MDAETGNAVTERTWGHAAHSKPADSQRGLPGEIARPLNVTFLGAGSMFCPTLCRDVLLTPGADRGEFRLVDIDVDRLRMMHRVIERLIEQTGRADGWSVRSTTDRREALAGTDYAVCCVEVSGVECVAFDNDIPLKFGVDQCIGDTIGPGGLFKALRTVPVFLDILRDMRALCPGALMLNYTNPMNMMVLAAGRAVPEVPVVGLCHSVQGTSHLLALRLGVPYEQLQWRCAGINHLAWFTEVKHEGVDQYPRLMAQAQAELHGNADESDNQQANDVWQDVVRKDMMLHFGAFITESSGHLSEYLPYYRKSDAGRALLRDGYGGGSRFYADNWPTWRADADAKRRRMVDGEETIELERSWEYASWIIEAIEKDAPYHIHGNVMNRTPDGGLLIDNLPTDGCVEVGCRVDQNGIHPEPFGKLPPQMAHVCASNMAVFDLGATAAIERSKEAAIHALLLDPLCAAVCTPSQITAMALEMFAAEAAYLDAYT